MSYRNIQRALNPAKQLYSLYVNRFTSQLRSSALEVDNIVITNDTKATLLNLISFGDQWLRSTEDATSNVNFLTPEKGYMSVPGCMAAVKLRVITTDPSSSVQVRGTADSRVALGLLALLSHSIEGMSREDILQLDVHLHSQKLGLSNLLPPGRLNGFQSMLQTVQNALKQTPTIAQVDGQKTAQYDHRCDEIAVLLSGGVDSSVALKLLLEQGHKVRAYYLKIWLEDEIAHLNECPWEEDLQYAQDVCKLLEVPLETLSLQQEYWEYVVQYTLESARLGLTPNPDIMCNSRIKFGMFYDYIGRYHNRIATGHYAHTSPLSTSHTLSRLFPQALTTLTVLSRAPDAIKDQSYFLSNLQQAQLQRCLFPLGTYHKEQVRALAEKYNLPTAKRKDSQGICFLGKLKFDDFIGHYMGESPGPIKLYNSPDDSVVGEHKGLWFHTIGQRKGVGLLLSPGYVHHGPWYIAGKNTSTNTLYVTNQMDQVDRPRRGFTIAAVNWHIAPLPSLQSSTAVTEGVLVDLKLRHGPDIVPGRLYPLHDGSGGVRVELVYRDEKSIAPGQFAAFYIEEYCIGAGMITGIDSDLLPPITTTSEESEASSSNSQWSGVRGEVEEVTVQS